MADDVDYADRRGSHATTYGQGFSWVVIWSIIGTFIPGTGLIAAGWRRLGGFILLLIGLGLALTALLALKGDVLKRVLDLALDRQKLLYITVATVAVGLVWIAIVLLTHSQLRRFANLTSGQRSFSSLVVVALVIVVALPVYKIADTAYLARGLLSDISSDDSQTVSSAPNSQAKDPWAGIQRENVLLIGSDAGKGRVGTRPDTMIVASIDAQTGATVLVSLPRNLQSAPFPDGTPGHTAWPNGYYCSDNTCLLNAVWTWAESENSPYYGKFKNPGLRATEDAIEGVTGLKINTWASLNLKGFQQFVDAIGGVTVNVNENIPIAGNSEAGCGLGGYIHPGKNEHLDGYHALWFARSRCASTDFDRIRRQRCVIGAVVQQTDPVTVFRQFPTIAKAAGSNIGTGIKESDFPAWVTLAERVKKGGVVSLPIDDKVLPTPADRVHPDYAHIRAIIANAIKTSTEPKASPSPSVSSSPSSTKSTTTSTNPDKAETIADACAYNPVK